MPNVCHRESTRAATDDAASQISAISDPSYGGKPVDQKQQEPQENNNDKSDDKYKHPQEQEEEEQKPSTPRKQRHDALRSSRHRPKQQRGSPRRNRRYSRSVAGTNSLRCAPSTDSAMSNGWVVTRSRAALHYDVPLRRKVSDLSDDKDTVTTTAPTDESNSTPEPPKNKSAAARGSSDREQTKLEQQRVQYLMKREAIRQQQYQMQQERKQQHEELMQQHREGLLLKSDVSRADSDAPATSWSFWSALHSQLAQEFQDYGDFMTTQCAACIDDAALDVEDHISFGDESSSAADTSDKSSSKSSSTKRTLMEDLLLQ